MRLPALAAAMAAARGGRGGWRGQGGGQRGRFGIPSPRFRAYGRAVSQHAAAPRDDAEAAPPRRMRAGAEPAFGPDARRLIDLADRAAAAIVAGAPSKRLFDQWRCIGRALLLARTAVAEQFGGRAGHLGKPWRDWLAAHPGLAAIKETERSHAVWIAEHETEICQWRDALPPKQRDRIHHPATARLSFTRHLREQQIIGSLAKKREAEVEKREDERCARTRLEKALCDLVVRHAALEHEVAMLRGRVKSLEAVLIAPASMRPKANGRAAHAA